MPSLLHEGCEVCQAIARLRVRLRDVEPAFVLLMDQAIGMVDGDILR
jgi:hypothetical protein